jgi:hypothetical protein
MLFPSTRDHSLAAPVASVASSTEGLFCNVRIVAPVLNSGELGIVQSESCPKFGAGHSLVVALPSFRLQEWFIGDSAAEHVLHSA